MPTNNIPANIRVPLFYAELDNSGAFNFMPEYRSLIIAQRLAAGTVAADELVLVSSADQAKEYFGAGSVLAQMVEAYRANDSFTELWCLPVDDNGAGVAATGDITITGAATASGTLNIYVAGQKVQVAVTSGDDATAVGDSIEAAITAASNLPVTAANVIGVVTLTARHKGEVGNDIDLRMNYQGRLGGEQTPAGVTVSITAMNSGASNPILTTALAALGDERYDYIIVPYTDTTSLDELKSFMDDTTGRWAYDQQIYGHVFSAKSGTVAALDTLGDARNDAHVSIMGFYDSPTPSYEVSAIFGAQSAHALSIDPARPLQTLPMIGFRAPPQQSRFTISEKNTLLFSGISTTFVEGGYVRIERVVTNYRENSWGQPDPSYLDVTTLASLSYILRFLRGRITQKWPRHKLANDGTRFGDGQAIITPNIIRAELVAAYADLITSGITENMEAFKENLIVERDQNDPNRVNVLYPPDLVNQLRVFALVAQFRLQYPASN
jgi:phage tail sheath gpL-like